MTRSLTVKWVLTLLVASLTGVVLVGIVASRTAVNEYDRLRIEQAQTLFVEDMATYYEAHGSWDDLVAAMQGFPLPGHDMGFPEVFALADAGGRVVAGTGPFHVGDQVSADRLANGVPITVDGLLVGTVLRGNPPPDFDPRELRYLESTNRALLIGALGAGGVALLIGVLLSRLFLRPLRDLTVAIGAMQRGKLNQQVRVRSEDELGKLAHTFNQMSAEIHRANQLRQQMTADVAHDLRTPLMVMMGYLEAMRDGTLEATPARFEAMHLEALQLRRLVEDLRVLSLADAGELRLQTQPVAASDLLEQIQHAFEPLAAEKQVALGVEIESGLPDLQIDRERMVQVLANLVTNGLRYTPAGGKMTLGATRSGTARCLTVTDTGSGIAPEHLPNVFERFYRTDASREEQQDESGLGLAIARSIVEAHGGTIRAESKLGKGTSMIITLAG
jgi:signal transduction histidine kinase